MADRVKASNLGQLGHLANNPDKARRCLGVLRPYGVEVTASVSVDTRGMPQSLEMPIPAPMVRDMLAVYVDHLERTLEEAGVDPAN